MKHPLYKYILVLVDVGVVYFSFVAAVWLYHGAMGRDMGAAWSHIQSNILFFSAYCVLCIPIFSYYNLYCNTIFTTAVRQSVLLARSIAVFTAGIALISFMSRSWYVPDSRLTILFFMIIATLSLILWRVLAVRLAYAYLKGHKRGGKRTLVVGGEKAVAELYDRLITSSSGFTPCCLVTTGTGTALPPMWASYGLPAATIDGIEGVIGVTRPKAVLIAYDGHSYEDLFALIDRCRKLRRRVFVFSRLLNVIPEYVVIDRYGDFSLVDISPESSDGFMDRLKHAIDMVMGLLIIIAMSPLFIFLAVAVKLSSAGPVFYKQTRVGKNGKPFTFYKFRSMYVDSDKDSWRISRTIDSITSGNASGASTKVVNRSSVTAIGSIMRKTSLDELPQLFNVIKGDMSLVGPRPPLPYEWDNYSPWHKKRLKSIPGCTGLWQVTARSKVGFNDTVLLDLYYLYNRSTWMDLKILFQTVAVVVLAKGGE